MVQAMTGMMSITVALTVNPAAAGCAWAWR